MLLQIAIIVWRKFSLVIETVEIVSYHNSYYRYVHIVSTTELENTTAEIDDEILV